MSIPSPSPNQTTRRRRRDGLAPLVLLALLLAVLPIGCIAELALRLITPYNEPFKDVAASTGLGAYQPFPPGISFAAVNPSTGSLQATEVARRALTPVGLGGAVTVEPVAEVGPPLAVTVPPTPTTTVPPTPRPTITPARAVTDVAGGELPASPSPTNPVVIPGVTTTPGPTDTPTRLPSRTPTPGSEPPATLTAIARTPVAPTSTAPSQATPVPTASPAVSNTPATGTTITPTRASTVTPTLPVAPSPTTTNAPATTSTSTPPPVATSTFTPPPVSTPTNTLIPINTPTNTPLPNTPTNTLVPINTPTNTPEPNTPTNTPVPLPELAITSGSITEGNTGTQVLTFTITLSAPAPRDVTVSWATVADTSATGATPGVDYTVSGGVATFGAGDQEVVVAVPIVGDLIVEANQTFFVDLSAPSNANIAVPRGVGTIIDDDLPVVSFTTATTSVTEGATGTTVNATLVVGLAAPAEREVRVNFQTSDNTALAPADYVAVTTGQAIFPPGAVTANVVTTVNGDDLVEGDESYNVQLLATTGVTIAGSPTGTVTILDDELPSISIGNTVVTEGNPGDTVNAVFNVTITTPPTADVTVNYATTSAGGIALPTDDYTVSSGTLTFTPTGPTTQQISVPINPDVIDERDENFFVNLTLVGGPAAIADNQGEATINDDDGPTLSLGPANVNANEGTPPGSGGVLTFQFTLSQPSVQDVTVRYIVNDGTATRANNDYVAATGIQTVIIPAGQVSRALSIPITADAAFENDETLTVVLHSLANAIPDPGASSATGTIVNDDIVQVNLAAAPLVVTEGDSGQTAVVLTVSLSRAPATTLTVDLSHTGGSATAGVDFLFTDETLTFTPTGPLSQQRTLLVNGDADAELDEQIQLQLLNLTGPFAQLGQDTRTITILTDELPTLTVSSPTVLEGNTGATQMTFVVTLSEPVDFPVEVDYATVAGSATSGADYTAVTSGAPLVFVPGVTTQNLFVDVIGDLAIEPDESFTMQLSNAVNATISGAGTGTIENDDADLIRVTKSGTGQLSNLGRDALTWTITVENIAATGSPAQDVILVDELPGTPTRDPGFPAPTLTASSGTIGYDGANDAVIWSDSLDPGEIATLTINLVFVDPVVCTSVANPSYTLTVEGISYEPVTNLAAVSVGSDCPDDTGELASRPRPDRKPAPEAEPTPSFTRTPTATPQASTTPTSAPTATIAPTGTVAPTDTPKPTVSPTGTPAPSATPTPTWTPEPTAEPTDTPEPTAEPTDTPEPTAEPTDTPEPTLTPTRTPTATAAPTASRTATRVPTATTQPTPSKTPTRAPTATATSAPTETATGEPTATSAPTATTKPAPSSTPQPTATSQPSATPRPTETPPPTEAPRPTEPPTPTSAPQPAPTLAPTPVDPSVPTATPGGPKEP